MVNQVRVVGVRLLTPKRTVVDGCDVSSFSSMFKGSSRYISPRVYMISI